MSAPPVTVPADRPAVPADPESCRSHTNGLPPAEPRRSDEAANVVPAVPSGVHVCPITRVWRGRSDNRAADLAAFVHLAGSSAAKRTINRSPPPRVHPNREARVVARRTPGQPDSPESAFGTGAQPCLEETECVTALAREDRRAGRAYTLRFTPRRTYTRPHRPRPDGCEPAASIPVTLSALRRSTSLRYGSMPARTGGCGTVIRMV